MDGTVMILNGQIATQNDAQYLEEVSSSQYPLSKLSIQLAPSMVNCSATKHMIDKEFASYTQ